MAILPCRAWAVQVFALALLSLPTVAISEVIHFDNSEGQFTWSGQFTSGSEVPGFEDRPLDPRKLPADQGSVLGLHQWSFEPQTNVTPGWVELWGDGGAAFAQGTVFDTGHGPFGSPLRATVAVFDPGDPIGPGLSFGTALAAWFQDPAGFTAPDALFVTDGLLGFRLTIAAVNHYGWVRVATRDDGTFQYDALEWAYESTPGVVIAAGATVPEPGAGVTLIALVFLFACVPGRSGFRGFRGVPGVGLCPTRF